jgi:plastocyanin
MRKSLREIGSVVPQARYLMILVAFGALALALSACGGSGGSGEASAANAGTGSEPQASVENIKVVIKSDEEHGKKGPEGTWHDAFLPADFSVKAGATVHVTVYNYDDMGHSFTSPQLGTNAQIAAGTGTEKNPGKTTFTFQAPAEAGSYEWICVIPCDPWAMSHDGFMKGYVTVS